MTRPQKRGARIAMTASEIDAFLTEQRVTRVATVGTTGPHATPLWFVWDGRSIWLYSLSGSQRWADLERDPRIALVVDGGEGYEELHGVEIRGRADVVGEVPRVGEPNKELVGPEAMFARKYSGRESVTYDGRHAWRRVIPDKITSWDFRKRGSL